MKVIVPSAKLITSELQSIGKIPPIIYPINQNISFDFFKLKYDDITAELDIICFESVDKVREKLATYKLSAKLNLIELERLEDLGYSVLQALTDKDSDVVIHFADTIVMDSLPFNEGDFFCYSQDYINETWTFYDLRDGQFTAVNDKAPPQSLFLDNADKCNFFVGVFKLRDGAYFKKCLENALKASSKDMDSFYSALMFYSKTHRFNSCEVKEWFDIGHTQLYFETRMQVESRTFNHIDIDQNRGILKKTSNDTEKFIGEIKWYLKLPTNLEYVSPRIFDYSLHYNRPHILMEYYSYRTLHELFLYGDLTAEQWEKIFRKIKFVLEDFSRYKLRDEYLTDSLRSMYLEKTLSRLNLLKEQTEFKSLFNLPVCINGDYYPSLNDVTKILEDIVPRLLFHVENFSIIHGDFCFTNVMIDTNFNFIKLIDPRGKFGYYDIYGDPRYEYAKLLHSIEGKYDYIIKGLFDLELRGENDFRFKILESARAFDLSNIFIRVFNEDLKNIWREVRLIESLLFFSMIPLHEENINHQYAMFCTAMKILDRLLKTGA